LPIFQIPTVGLLEAVGQMCDNSLKENLHAGAMPSVRDRWENRIYTESGKPIMIDRKDEER